MELGLTEASASSAANIAAVNPNGIKTLLANG